MATLSTNTGPKSQHGQFLHRFLHLLMMCQYELEWEQTDTKISPERRKKLAQYNRNHIGWLLRDILTSTPNSEAYNMVFEELNSERAKDLALWLDFGLNLENIGEVLDALQSLNIKQ